MEATAATFQVFMNHPRNLAVRILQAVLLLGIFLSVLFWMLLHWGQIPMLLWMISCIVLGPWYWRRSGYIPAELIANTDGLQWVLQEKKVAQHSNIIPWEQLAGFQVAFQGRGPNVLVLKWVDGQKTRFYFGEARLAFEYLVTHFPEKEKAYWWPPNQTSKP